MGRDTPALMFMSIWTMKPVPGYPVRVVPSRVAEVTVQQTHGLLAAVLVLVAAVPAHAQMRHGSTPPPAPAPAPAARPRVGYAADPQPPPEPVRTVSPVYFYQPGGYVVVGAPYQVLSDGSLLVDLGNGYERVLRQCGLANSSDAVQVNQTGRDALGRILDPPGIAALKAGTRGQATGNAPARNASACYRSDAQGRVEMVSSARQY